MKKLTIIEPCYNEGDVCCKGYLQPLPKIKAQSALQEFFGCSEGGDICWRHATVIMEISEKIVSSAYFKLNLITIIKYRELNNSF